MSGNSTAEDIRSGAEASYAAIRNNDQLSPAGRRAQIAKVYAGAKQQMDDLRAGNSANVEADRLRYMRTAFAAPTDAASVLSYRDATDRAQAVSNAKDGLALINRAVDTGDTMLARAVGQRAFDEVKDGGLLGSTSGWQDVLQAYADSTPSTVTDAINGLIEQQRQGSRNPLMSLFDYMLAKPSEISGMSDHELASL